MRQLPDELRRIDRAGRILILQLRYQQLQKHVVQTLAGRQTGEAGGVGVVGGVGVTGLVLINVSP